VRFSFKETLKRILLVNQIFRNLILLIVLNTSAAFAVGFQTGNDFTVVPLSGRLILQCSGAGGGIVSTPLNCYTEILNPNEFEYFVGPAGVAAEKVKLSCIQQDGTVVEKNMDYDSKNGRTVKRVNLWINTLLQTALLNEGKNKIHFAMTKNGQPVQEGDFEADVKIGKNVGCATISIYDNQGLNLCNNPNSACQSYFEQLNYCQ
jgi:hypothetical protein